MAQFDKGSILPIALHEEMQRSYLEYAMSVIVGRALPDVRDGLKPVHRRILYAMYELGLTPDRPYRKCARVVGDVLGKYHPHGDQAVYDALVRMVQDFSSRAPLISGHGNFGSVDNDPPAAMRYTECRLAALGLEALLADVHEEIVDFVPNFDGSQLEPSILPARLPVLLLNGSDGIAVGMATKIPPHNLSELIEATLALMERPELTSTDLMRYVPAPDFPTGGEIVVGDGLPEFYTQGRGSITMRGVAQVEDIQPGKGRHRRTAIVITEFPFQVNKAAWIEKVADLVNQGRIADISDLRDESDRDGIRVVIELKREAQPEVVLNQLYKFTPLQSNFGAILLTLVDNEPRQLDLATYLQAFIEFRLATLRRIFSRDLERAQARSSELVAMQAALENLDAVITILRQARDAAVARTQLQDVLALTAPQADTILAMPLRRLTGLEQEKIQTELQQVMARITELEQLLRDRESLLRYLKKDLKALKKQHSTPRRTRLVTEAEPEIAVTDLIANEAVVIQHTTKGYVQRWPIATFNRRQGLGLETEVEDCSLEALSAMTLDQMLVFAASGRAYSLPVHSVPATSGRSKGTPLTALLPEDNRIASVVVPAPETMPWLIVLTQQGRLKRLPLVEFRDLRADGLMALRLKEDDALGWVALAEANDTIAIATVSGRLLRLGLDQVPELGRAAQGVQALRLRRHEQIVGLCTCREPLVLVTRQGYGKRLDPETVRLVERGGIGTQALTFTSKQDGLVSLLSLPQSQTLGLYTSGQRLLRLSVAEVPLRGRTVAAERLLETAPAEVISHVYAAGLPEAPTS